MSEIVNQSLQKIAKGTGIVFIGTMIGMLLGFVSRIIIVRYITQSEYGIYSLALVLISIFATISTLGLQEGATRYIAYFRGKNEEEKVKGVISSSIKIAIITSISLAIISFSISDFISTSIFHVPELSTPLKVFSIAIPFTVLINAFIAIFRGFDRVGPSVYFQNIFRPVLFILFLIAAILFGGSFLSVIYAYLTSIAVTCLVFVMYMFKKSPLPIMKSGSSTTIPIARELLSFSIPLLAVNMLIIVMSWTDTIMLGYFKTPDVVGLYNAALPLANLLPIVLTSLGFLYTPIVSSLYGKNQMEELGRSYAISTKWCFIGTLPIFFVLFLFPDVVLNLLFGSRYIGAAIALQILTLGFFLNPVTGPNYHTLIAMGKTKIIMQTFLISGIVNIILNIILIPSLGIVGAAIASASALAIATTMLSLKLYLFSGIHPLTKNYLKPLTGSTIVIFIFTIAKNFLTVTFTVLFVLLVLFLFISAFLLLLTKSFDNEDITILLEIEKRSGIDLTMVKKLLKKFI